MITAREFTDVWIATLQALRSYALWLCRNPLLIDDLVQQTALQAWQSRHQLRASSNLRSWLFVILRNCHYAQARRPKLEVEYPEGELLDSIATDPSHDADRELTDLQIALKALPNEQRQAVLGVVLHGLSYAEAARRFACKEGTIKSRVARARERLLRAVGRTRSQGAFRSKPSPISAVAPRDFVMTRAISSIAPDAANT